MEDKFLDFLSLHKKELQKIYAKSLPNNIRSAFVGIASKKLGVASFRSRSTLKRDLRASWRSRLDAAMRDFFITHQIPVRGDSVEIYGKNFSFVNFEEVVSGFLSIVIHDQYNAHVLLKDDSIVFDVGANIGVFSVFASHLCPKGKVYGFEPASMTFRALEKNAAQYPRISAHRFAIGDKEGSKKLFIKPWALGANYVEDTIMPHDQGEFVGSEAIAVTTIDTFMQEHNIPRIDFIKIDAEGYELNILKGAAQAIRNFSPVIAVSAYHHPSHKEEIPKLVLSINPKYTYELRAEDDEDFIFTRA